MAQFSNKKVKLSKKEFYVIQIVIFPNFYQ